MTLTETSTYRGLLDAILADPADDTPRLILADYLDEHGSSQDRDRAELIRVGCARARSVVDASEDPYYHRECELYALPHVQQALLPPAFTLEWGMHIMDVGVIWEGWFWKTPRITHVRQQVISPILDRGFIGEVCASVTALQLCMHDVWIMHPITRVQVFQRRPLEDEHLGFAWVNEAFFEDTDWPDEDEVAVIPAEWFGLLPPPEGHPEEEWRRHHPDRANYYGDEAEALAALSSAVVRWSYLAYRKGGS